METRRSGRNKGRVSYVEPLVFDEDDDGVMTEGRLKQAEQELKAEKKRKKAEEKKDEAFRGPSIKGGAKKKQTKRQRFDLSAGSKETTQATNTLSALLDLPLDLLATIFASLAPIDLLQVSRANKKLYGWLQSREATGIWVQSRKAHTIYVEPTWGQYRVDGWAKVAEGRKDFVAIEPPPRPSHITEAAYTAHLYEKTNTEMCYVKGCKRYSCISDIIQSRGICYRCIDSRFSMTKESLIDAVRQCLGTEPDPDILRVVSQFTEGTWPGYCLDDALAEHERLQSKRQSLSTNDFTAWLENQEQKLRDQAALSKTAKFYMRCMSKYEAERDGREAQERAERLRKRRVEYVENFSTQHDVPVQDIRTVVFESDLGPAFDTILSEQGRQELDLVVAERVTQCTKHREAESEYARLTAMRQWLLRQTQSILKEHPVNKLPTGERYKLPSILPFFDMPDLLANDAQTSYATRVDLVALWESSKDAILIEAEIAMSAILQDLLDKLEQAEQQLKPKLLMPKSTAEEPLSSLQLWEKLNSPNAFFACQLCKKAVFSFTKLMIHEHIIKIAEPASYKDALLDRQVKRRSSQWWNSREAPFASSFVSKPVQITFATSFLRKICERDCDATVEGASDEEDGNAEEDDKAKVKAEKGEDKNEEDEEDESEEEGEEEDESDSSSEEEPEDDDEADEDYRGSKKRIKKQKPQQKVIEPEKKVKVEKPKKKKRTPLLLPKTLEDIRWRYRFICRFSDCHLRSMSRRRRAYAGDKKDPHRPRRYADMVKHLATHYLDSLDAKETLIKLSQVELVKR